MSYLVDTSVWAEYFRQRGTPGNQQLDRLIATDPRDVLGCPPVRMELAHDPDDLRRHRLLSLYDGFPTTGIASDDFDIAAALYRATRVTGHTVRSQMDCVIAAIALRRKTTLVHNDVDFDRISAAVPELAILRLPSS